MKKSFVGRCRLFAVFTAVLVSSALHAQYFKVVEASKETGVPASHILGSGQVNPIAADIAADIGDSVRDIANSIAQSFLRQIQEQLWGPVIHTGTLTVRYVRATDLQLGNTLNSTYKFMRPSTPEGWVRLGDVASSNNRGLGTPVMIVKDDPRYLKMPEGFDLVWGDNWDNFSASATTIWFPRAPSGYVAMGFAVQGGSDEPYVGLYRCVREDLVVKGQFKGFGAFSNYPNLYMQLYGVVPLPGSGPVLAPNTVWWGWWDDRFGANENSVPRIPHVGNAGGSPSRAFVTPYLLKGVDPQKVYDDAVQGITALYQSRVDEASTKGAGAFTSDPALQQHFGTFAATLQKAQAAIAAANASAPAPGLTTNRIPVTPQPTQPNDLPKATSSYAQGQSAQPAQPPPIREWSVGSTFDSSNNSATRSLSDLPGLRNIPAFQNVQLSDAKVFQGKIAAGPERDQPYIVATGNVTVNLETVGNITGRAVALSRLYVQDGLRSGILVFISTDQIRSAAHLNESPLSQLGLSQAAVAFATEPHQWLQNELPEEVRTELAKILPQDHPLAFRKDVTVMMKASLNGAVSLDKYLTVVPPELLLTGIFPGPTNEKFKLVTEPLGEFNTSFLPPSLALGKPSLEFVPGSAIALVAPFSLNIADVVKCEMPLRLEFPAGGVGVNVAVSGKIPGDWNNPFGVPDMALKNMTLFGTFGGATPSLGLGADTTFLGKQMRIAGSFSFAPLTLSALKAADLTLSLDDIAKVQQSISRSVSSSASVEPVAIPGQLIEIRNAAMTVASVSVPSEGIEKGTTYQGDLHINGAKVASALVRVSSGNGLRIQTVTDPVSLGPISITGSGGDRGPKLDLLYWPLTTPPYNLQQHCYFTGKITVAGAGMDALMILDRQKVSLDMHGQLAGSKITMTATGNNVIDDLSAISRMNVMGEFSSDFCSQLENKVVEATGNNEAVKFAVKMIGSSIFRVKSAGFQTSYEYLMSGGPVTLNVACSILGSDFNVPLPFALNSSGPDSLVSALANKVIEEAKKNFADVWDAAWNAAKGAAEAVANEAKAAAEASAQAANQAIETSYSSLTSAADSARAVGETIVSSIVDSISAGVSKLKFW